MGVSRDAMVEALALRGLAPRTWPTYLNRMRRRVRFCRVAPDELTTEHVRVFLLDLSQGRNVSFSTFNQALNAARFFFVEVLKKPFVLEGALRAAGERSEEEPPRARA